MRPSAQFPRRSSLLRLLGGCALDLAREASRDAVDEIDDRLHEAVADLVDSRLIGAIAFTLVIVTEFARAVTGRE